MLDGTVPRGLPLRWMGLVGVIGLFSLYGRPLLAQLREFIPRAWLGPLLTLLLLVVVITLVAAATRRQKPLALLHLLWLVPLIGGAAASLSIVEERVHLLLFGLLGFFALPLFGILRSVLACSLVALLDEWLQLWLPSRVGEWNDVMLDVASALAGLSLALWLAAERRAGYESCRSAEVEGDG